MASFPIALAIVLFAATVAARPLAAGQVPILSVGLSLSQKQVMLGSSRGFEIQDPTSGRALRKFGPGGRVQLKSRGKGIGFGEKMTLLRLVVRPVAGGYLELDGKPYRGYFEIREGAGGRITVANQIDIESYLYSVVKSEMPAGAGAEALKVQAIISRTFALKNRENFSDRGFGLKATEESQVYAGMRNECGEGRAAVEATRGMVLSSDGQLAGIFYSASCGGATDSNETVWGGAAEPHLTPVVCSWCRSYSGFHWQADLPFDEISRRLRANGFPVGRIQSIGLSRSAAGRVKALLIRSDRGESLIPGNKFRLIMGHRRVKSLRFNFLRQVAMAPSGEGGEASDAAIRQIIHQYITAGATVNRSSSGAVLRVAGTGFGHGVGLCQWGAKAQAEAGHAFRDILYFYFGGTRLARAY